MAAPLSAAGASSLLAGDEEDTREVPVEHMDYDYVNRCTDWKYLKRVLEVLRSGKEGRYFHLEEHTEKRMIELMPRTEKIKWHALHSEPTRDDVDEANDSIAEWLSGVSSGDSELTSVGARRSAALGSSGDIFDKANLPPVRQAGSTTTGGMSVTGSGGSGEVESKGGESGPAPVRGGGARGEQLGSGTGRARRKVDPRKKTFKEYYDSWDKFDVEEVEQQMDVRAVTTPNHPMQCTVWATRLCVRHCVVGSCAECVWGCCVQRAVSVVATCSAVCIDIAAPPSPHETHRAHMPILLCPSG